jgi:transposase
MSLYETLNPLRPELNPICCLLAFLAHHFLHVSRIRVKSLTLRLLMSYIYIYIYDISNLRVKNLVVSTISYITVIEKSLFRSLRIISRPIG